MEGAMVQRIPPGERVEGPSTAGMVRSQAVASERIWAGLVRTKPGMVSGWHHHGDHESAIYVVSVSGPIVASRGSRLRVRSIVRVSSIVLSSRSACATHRSGAR